MEAFTDAVRQIEEISNHLKPGLSALKGNSHFVKVVNTKNLNESKAYFMEVHPADTSNAKEMLRKVLWLKLWLSGNAKPLKDIHADGYFHWCPSGRVKISPNSPQYRQILSAGIKITKTLNLR